jgi:transcription elongation factor Elf1
MPNTLPAPCPKCHHERSTLIVSSTSVLTITCPQCGHTWSLDLKALSSQMRAKLAAALVDD